MNRKYDLRFKKMACELLGKFENSPSRVAKELTIPVKTYEKWICVFKKDPHSFDEETVSFEIENKALRKMLREREETIMMLKKAYAFFTEKERY